MDTYTREELIQICERAVVPQDQWNDRDCADAHYQLGKAWALLKAGCNFTVKVEDETIWVTFTVYGFRCFEYADKEEYEAFADKESCYLPTVSRLEERNGKDWY